MTWRRLIIRQDSMIRYWCVGMLDCAGGYSSVYDSPYLKNIKFFTHIAFSSGAEHIISQEMMGLTEGLIEASHERLTLFREIGEAYIDLGHRWHNYLKKINKQDLTRKSNKELLKYLQNFSEYYTKYAPILYVPFVVERRYMAEYPEVLRKISGQITEKFYDQNGKHEDLDFLFGTSTSKQVSQREIQGKVNEVVEHSIRRTMTEDKDYFLEKLAAEVMQDPMSLPLFQKKDQPILEEIRVNNPRIAEELEKIHSEYSWIKHWGYPPFYKEFTVEEFIQDVVDRVKEDAIQHLAKREENEIIAKKNFQKLINLVELSQSEKQLLEDLNYYNFLRTYRMEIKIKAQYLSIPLFLEIERRGVENGVMKPDDIFLMIPPETMKFLVDGTVPQDLNARKNKWALYTHAQSKTTKIYSGDEYDSFVQKFFSVIEYRENARDLNIPTNKFVGGKAANLFILNDGGITGLPFFVVTTEAYKNFLQSSGLGSEIINIIKHDGKKQIPFNEVEGVSNQIKELFIKVPFPNRLADTIMEMYNNLDLSEVAVRSSATVEDAPDLSWAGRFNTEIYVLKNNLLNSIKNVWASLYSPLAIRYAIDNSIDLTQKQMAVIVQEMIDPIVSGVINTVYNTEHREILEIELCYGQGNPLVSGEITPDTYLVQKGDLPIIKEKRIAKQKEKLTRKGFSTIPINEQDSRKIADNQIIKLAKISQKIEILFGSPQDIEWLYTKKGIIIVQSRPQTGLLTQAKIIGTKETIRDDLLFTGLKGKISTIFTGTARVLGNLSEGNRLSGGEILVIHAATPAWDPIIFKAKALITNEGGSTSHAIRVSNERNIPAVVGSSIATEIIHDGDKLIIDTSSDPFKGKVYKVKK